MSYQPARLIGVVTRTGAQTKLRKTITVVVSRKLTHPILLKEMNRSKKYLVHDEAETASLGDRVEIQLGRPLSARKRFFLEKILSSSSSSASASGSPSSSAGPSTMASASSSQRAPTTPSAASASEPTTTHPTSSEEHPTSISSLATAFQSAPLISEDALPSAKVESEQERLRRVGRKRQAGAAARLGIRI